MYKVVIYGLGKEFQKQKFILEREYQIIGLSDKKLNLKELYSNYIEPERLHELDLDYVYVTSSKYYEDI